MNGNDTIDTYGQNPAEHSCPCGCEDQQSCGCTSENIAEANNWNGGCGCNNSGQPAGILLQKTVSEDMGICNVNCILSCCVSHSGLKYFYFCGTLCVVVKYTIYLKYVDCCGCERTAVKRGSALFFGLQGPFDCKNLMVCFSEAEAHDSCGKVCVSFDIKLSY